MAPVVHFEDGFLHAQSLYTLLQFLEEHHAGIIQVLIVDADRQNEMTEEQLWYLITPSHLVACLETGAHILQEEAGWIVGDISHRHVSIEELQGTLLVASSFLLLKHLLVVKLLTYQVNLLLKGRFHLRAISCIGNEMVICRHHCLPRGKKHNSEHY